MAVKKRGNVKKRQPINTDRMVKVEPLTENQKTIFKAWDEGKHLFIYGAAVQVRPSGPLQGSL